MTIGRVFQAQRGIVWLGLVFGLGLGHSALAAEKAGSGGFMDSVLETLNLKTKLGSTPDFVEATHPDPSTLHFIPTGTRHPQSAVPVKSPSDIEATKAALDAARDAQLLPKPAPGPPRQPGKRNKASVRN